MMTHGKTYAELGRTLPVAGQKTAAGAVAWLKGQDLGVGQDRLAEPYRLSAWVRAAVKLIAGPISAVELEFYRPSAMEGRRRSRRDAGEALDVPVMAEWLRSPMAGFGFSDLVEATVGWRRLTGEAFWLLPDAALLLYGRSEGGFQVVVARPDRMRHVVDGGKLVGWEFTDAAGKRWALLPEQVIHSKCWNPYDAWRGLGDYEAARIAADGDYQAAKFARNVAANNGDTGPYIVAKNGVPSREQREQLLADLRAKRFAQARGEFRPMFMAGDITVEDPQIRSVDASYTAARIENRHEVAVAFGIPPSLFDVKAAYSIGSASDYFQLMFNTCQPEGRKVCGMVEIVAKRMARVEVEARLNWDEHPVFQEIRKERLSSVDSLWSKGVPMNAIDEYLGLGLPDFEGKEIAYLPFSVAPVGETKDAAEAAEFAEPTAGEDGEEAVSEAIRSLMGFDERGKKRSKGTRGTEGFCACGCGAADLAVRADDSKRARLWKSLMAKRQETMRAYRTRFTRVLMSARNEVLEKLEGAIAQESSTTRAAAADFMFDVENFATLFRGSMRSVALSALETAGKQALKELGKDDPWKVPPAEALQFVQDRENRLSGVPDDVFEDIKGVIEQGLQEGQSLKTVAANVRAEFNDISDRRAFTIASTETSAAYGFARQEAMAAHGVQWKEWLTSGNANVRAAHRAMDGAIVGINERFTVIDPQTGEADEILHPSDPAGAAWNVINCHCVVVMSTKGKS